MPCDILLVRKTRAGVVLLPGHHIVLSAEEFCAKDEMISLDIISKVVQFLQGDPRGFRIGYEKRFAEDGISVSLFCTATRNQTLFALVN
jgi:hypothetical protein